MRILKFLLILLIILFFVLLMISFSFPDLFALFYVPNMLFGGNIYSQVLAKKAVCVWLDATYPPMYYLTVGVYLKVVQFLQLLPSYLFSINDCPVFELILDKRFLFWVKLPYLIIHGLSAFVFSKFFPTNRFKWFLFWLLNPIVIFVCFMFGQFEIIPAFFIILSLYLAKREKVYLSFLALGMGAAYKNFPFLLVFPFFFYLTKGTKEKLVSLILLILPYVLSLSPYLNKDYLKFAVFSENTKMLDLGFYLGETKISVYVALFVILILAALTEKVKNFNYLLKYCFAFSLIYFLTSAWGPQRFLFLLPTLLLISSQSINIFRLLPVVNIAYFFYFFLVYLAAFDHTLLRPLFGSVIAFPYIVPSFILPRRIAFSSILAILFGFGLFSFKDEFHPVTIKNRDIILGFLVIPLYFVLLIYLLFASGSLG